MASVTASPESPRTPSPHRWWGWDGTDGPSHHASPTPTPGPARRSRRCGPRWTSPPSSNGPAPLAYQLPGAAPAVVEGHRSRYLPQCPPVDVARRVRVPATPRDHRRGLVDRRVDRDAGPAHRTVGPGAAR